MQSDDETLVPDGSSLIYIYTRARLYFPSSTWSQRANLSLLKTRQTLPFLSRELYIDSDFKMKGAASLSFVTLAFSVISGVVSAPAAMDRDSPIADVIERQSGVTCSADAAITVTDATPLNETSAIEERQAPLPGVSNRL